MQVTGKKTKPAKSHSLHRFVSTSALGGLWKMWLRENGRWSLWHKIKRGNQTACGWSYAANLESKKTNEIAKELPMLVCADCATGINTGDGMKLGLLPNDQAHAQPRVTAGASENQNQTT
jgi:hypothetical protein